MSVVHRFVLFPTDIIFSRLSSKTLNSCLIDVGLLLDIQFKIQEPASTTLATSVYSNVWIFCHEKHFHGSLSVFFCISKHD